MAFDFKKGIETTIVQKKRISILDDCIKRTFDVVVSSFCLIVFSPLFLYCYIAIKKEDGGKVIFSQERIGKGGKPFFIYKFRSMKVEAEEMLYTGEMKELLWIKSLNDEEHAQLMREESDARIKKLEELDKVWANI